MPIFKYPFLFLGLPYGVKPAWIAFAFFLWRCALMRSKEDTIWEAWERFKNGSDSATFPRVVWELLVYIGGVLCCWLPDVTDNAPFLMNFAEKALKLEIPAALLLLLLLWRARFYKNKEQYLSVVEKAGKFLISLFIACTMACHVLDWEACQPRVANIVWLVALLFLWGPLFPFRKAANAAAKAAKKGANGEESRPLTTAPLERYSELSDKQKWLADKLIKTLKSQLSESLSVCVSGKWGSGKTSIVNGALERLRKEGVKYEEIRINALNFDTSQNLLNYVYERIRTILKERGVYVGVGSEYQKFLLYTAKYFASQNSLRAISLAEQTLFPSVPDYRERKAAIERLLRDAMTDSRIIIVADDIERCDEQKAKEFLFFAREAATLSHCAVIFITDYDYLAEKVEDASETRNPGLSYLEKFFDIRFDVPDMEIEHIRALFQNELKTTLEVVPVPSFEDNALDGEWFHDKTFQQLEEDSKLVKKELLLAEKERRTADLSNARNLVKIFRKLMEYYDAMEKAFTRYRNQADDRAKLTDFLRIILSDRVLFFLAYLYVVFPREYDLLQKDVSGYFHAFEDAPAFPDSHEPQDVSRSLIGKLGDGLFFDIWDNSNGDNVNRGNGLIKKSKTDEYLKQNRIRFVTALLSRNPENALEETVKPFTTRAGELLSALDNGQVDADNLSETIQYACIYSLTQLQAVNERRRERLWKRAEASLKDGKWNADDLLFSCLLNNGVIESSLRFMKDVYRTLTASGADWIQNVDQSIRKEVLALYKKFLEGNLSRVCSCLSLYSRFNANGFHVAPLREILADNETEYLKRFLERLRDNRERLFPKLDETLLRVPAGEDSAEMLNVLRGLRDKVAEDLKNYQDLFDAEDIREAISEDMLNDMDSAIEEIDCFMKLCAKLRDSEETSAKTRFVSENSLPYNQNGMDVTKAEDIQRAIDNFQQAPIDKLLSGSYDMMTLRNDYEDMIRDIDLKVAHLSTEQAKALLEIADKLQFTPWGKRIILGALATAVSAPEISPPSDASPSDAGPSDAGPSDAPSSDAGSKQGRESA